MESGHYAAQQVTAHKEALEHHRYALHLLQAREYLHTALIQAIIETLPPDGKLKKRYLNRLVAARDMAKQTRHPWDKERLIQLMDIEHPHWIDYLNACESRDADSFP